jgi:hypothetical protein
MTRRQMIRRATLLSFGATLAYMPVVKAEGGQLSVDLDQWAVVVFKHKGRKCAVPVAEVFEALVAPGGSF